MTDCVTETTKYEEKPVVLRLNSAIFAPLSLNSFGLKYFADDFNSNNIFCFLTYNILLSSVTSQSGLIPPFRPSKPLPPRLKNGHFSVTSFMDGP